MQHVAKHPPDCVRQNAKCDKHHAKIMYKLGKIFFRWPSDHNEPDDDVNLQLLRKEMTRIGAILRSYEPKTTKLIQLRQDLPVKGHKSVNKYKKKREQIINSGKPKRRRNDIIINK